MKKFILCLLIFIVLVVGGIGAYLLTFDINAYHADVEKKLSEIIGQPVKVGGDMFMEKSLTPTLILQDVTIEDSSNDDKNLLTAKEVMFRFDILAYIKNVYVVDDMQLTGVELNLVRDKAGQDNWMFLFEEKDRKGGVDESHRFSLNHFRANSLAVTYKDAQKNTERKLDFSRLTMEQLVNLEGNFVYNGEKGVLKGSFMNLQEALSGAGKLEFVMDVVAYGMQTTVSCLIPDLSNAKEKTLNIHIVGENLNKSLNHFYAFPKAPEVDFDFQAAVKVGLDKSLSEGAFSVAEKRAYASFTNVVHDYAKKMWGGRVKIEGVNENFMETYGLKPFILNNTFQLGQDRIIVQFSGTANESDVEGTLSTTLGGEKRFVTGQIKSRYFSLKDVIADVTRNSLSSKQFDVSLLDKTDADVYVLVENFDAKGYLKTFPQIYTHLILKDGQLDIDVLEGTRIANGAVVGKAEVHASGKRLNGSAHLLGEKLSVDEVQMFHDLFKNGIINNELKGKFSGLALQDWIPSFTGKNVMTFSDEIVVLGMASILNGLNVVPFDDLSGRPVRLGCSDMIIKNGFANMRIKDGLVKMENSFAFSTNCFDASLEGEINLKDDTFSLNLYPFSWKKTEHFRNYVLMTGALSDWDMFRYSKQNRETTIEDPYDKLSRKIKVPSVGVFLGRVEEDPVQEEDIIPDIKDTPRSRTQSMGIMPANGSAEDKKEQGQE